MGKRIFYVALICLTLIACGHHEDNQDNENFLSIKTINSTFYEKGIKLKNSSIELPENLCLKNIQPTIYTFGECQETYILVYVFDSIQKRYEVMDELREKEKCFEEWLQGNLDPIFLHAKNTGFILLPETDIVTSEEDLKQIKLISDDIFYELNNGKFLCFQGQGKSWTGMAEIKYFKNFWKDDKNKLHLDSYHNQCVTLKYNGENPEEIRNIKYKYSVSSGEGSGEKHLLNQEGIIVSRSGGNGAIPYEDDIYTVTIEWKGQTETFKLINSKN